MYLSDLTENGGGGGGEEEKKETDRQHVYRVTLPRDKKGI